MTAPALLGLGLALIGIGLACPSMAKVYKELWKTHPVWSGIGLALIGFGIILTFVSIAYQI